MHRPTGGNPLRILIAGLVGLLFGAFGAAEAQEGNVFKILKLEGHQVRWQVPRDGEPRVVTYQLVNGPVEFSSARNCRKITNLDELIAASQIDAPTLRTELAAAFSMWEAAANITFREVPEGTRANILIGGQMEPEGWAFADVFYDIASSEPYKPISKALVCLNPSRRWKVGFDGDLKKYDLRYTFAHEIGHAIGLDHPGGGDQIMGTGTKSISVLCSQAISVVRLRSMVKLATLGFLRFNPVPSKRGCRATRFAASPSVGEREASTHVLLEFN